MGHTVNSIVINAPYELVFDISNKIERWTEFLATNMPKPMCWNVRTQRNREYRDHFSSD